MSNGSKPTKQPTNKKARSTGAQRIADMFGEVITDEERQVNLEKSQPKAPPATKAVPPPAPEPAPAIDLSKLPRERINTTLDPQTMRAFAEIQAHALSQGWKKPKIGEIIDDGVKMLLEKYKIKLG